jgi:hypothetical protein
VREISGIELCLEHFGIMTEGTDYHPDGLGCEYPECESDESCRGTSIFYNPEVEA